MTRSIFRKFFFVSTLSCSLVAGYQLICFSQPSTGGKEFWMAYMEGLDEFVNGPPRFSFTISSEVNTTGAITFPSTGYSIPFSIQANQPKEIYIPFAQHWPTTSEVVENRGILVTSNDTIKVLVTHYRLYFTDASIVLPINELGSEYIITSLYDVVVASPSEFIVVATENNTELEITPSVATYGLHGPGLPLKATMNRGQVYQVKAGDDLSGTIVKAKDNKKVAVFSGNKNPEIYCSSNNHVFDQQYPVKTWANEYVYIPFAYRDVGPTTIVASEDNTVVKFNCNQGIILHERWAYDAEFFETTYITSNKPISLTQFMAGSSCNTINNNMGDANMLTLPPLSYQAHEVGWCPTDTNIPGGGNPFFKEHYVSLVVAASDTNYILLDGVSIGSLGFNQLLNTQYLYKMISVSAGPHTLKAINNKSFYAYAHGYGNYDAYTNFLGYDRVVSGNTFSLTKDENTCKKKEIKFTSNAPAEYIDILWNFGDGHSSKDVNTVHEYDVTGNYVVSFSALGPDGCFRTEYLNIDVVDCSCDENVFVPNAFSPNADLLNDSLKVLGKEFTVLELAIYDRWGNKVFEVDGENKAWDGSYKGKPLDTGTFVYYLKFICNYTNEEKLRHGSVQLMR